MNESEGFPPPNEFWGTCSVLEDMLQSLNGYDELNTCNGFLSSVHLVTKAQKDKRLTGYETTCSKVRRT